jgi:hypothetical protein
MSEGRMSQGRTVSPARLTAGRAGPVETARAVA